jgi:hypothetical protein
MEMKTKVGRKVEEGIIYECKYISGNNYKYGYCIYNSINHSQVDIICIHGGVTYRDPIDVVFLKKYR